MNGNNFLLELSGSSKPNCQQRHVSLNRGIGKNLLKQYSKKSSLFSIYKNTSEVSFGTQNRTWLSVQCTGKIPGETRLFKRKSFFPIGPIWMEICSIYIFVSLTQVPSLGISRPDFSTKMAVSSRGDLQMGQIIPARKFPPKTPRNCLSIVNNRNLLGRYYKISPLT